VQSDKIFDTLRLIARDVAPVAQARIAAAVVFKKEIIALGVCKKQTHPLQKRFAKNPQSIYLHSEVDALRNVLRKHSPKILTECSLYVVRQKYLDNDKEIFVDGIAKPCPGCQKAIKHFKIPHVYWSTDDY